MQRTSVYRSHNARLHHKCFTDHCIQEVHTRQKQLGKKHLLFVSDMRRSVDEAVIEDDMKKQAQWARDCLASAVSLKFRLPYDTDYFTYLDGNFKERQFDVKDYDHKMHFFNVHWRGATSEHPGALHLTSRFPKLYLQKHEAAAEYLIARLGILGSNKFYDAARTLLATLWQEV
ncbi:hypothetical protein WJX82_008685 [Trebouxia sp. C0006]